ncbi:putrescine/spermidine ABC transporter permease [Mesorhizobium hungaricum]|jgi:putrescine transport system permease protein|uniref:Putrescine/spermidine ABC transporter permease n=1 Tax=Mesorhizobium hungaricum TaxID=1566387 RepID=A0A1C2E3H3_9HYPH|nr:MULTISPECIES: ABC transporter permease subunit [Mesorhizobium]MBN9235890.1 ABC transporter permease subunit [Mesorhizobium sp.]OCX21548.1 putrescine/spermidine ABC transporter permease [Mesorhizobium hungaricum]
MTTQRQRLLISIPYLWLIVFFLLPFAIIVKISLSHSTMAMPPYLPVLNVAGGWSSLKAYFAELNLENYVFVLKDSIYVVAYLNSVKIAAVATAITLLLGYPIAYAIASASSGWKPILIMLINLPFWTSFLIRIYAWIVVLSKEGVLNHLLISVGVISEPLTILNTNFAVYLGIVYAYLPLMIFPIYATLEKLDISVYEAARDLGCSRASAFFRVTLPLSRPGIIAGCFLVFIPATGEFVIPSLLGTAKSPMIGRLLWEEFFVNNDWPLASAISVLLLAILIVPIVLYQFYRQSVERRGG